jgi:hypothetical protein
MCLRGIARDGLAHMLRQLAAGIKLHKICEQSLRLRCFCFLPQSLRRLSRREPTIFHGFAQHRPILNLPGCGSAHGNGGLARFDHQGAGQFDGIESSGCCGHGELLSNDVRSLAESGNLRHFIFELLIFIVKVDSEPNGLFIYPGAFFA